MSALKGLLWGVLGSALFAVVSCAPGSPQTGSQTNWLMACDTSDDCGGLECLCGTCTVRCSEDAECEETGGSCVPATDEGAIALCDGQTPSEGMCLARCGDVACPNGSSCVAGVCSPLLEASVHVDVAPEVQHQALVGVGASLAYNEDIIVDHPNKAALYDVMFAESGLDVIRLRNRFEGDNQDSLQITSEIVSEATGRLGRTPTLFMTSGSPPAALKANGDRYCSNSDPLCTLARDMDGGFDYAGFAEYWRSSLEAYATVGIEPDYVSLQNNTDWIPPDADGPEACRFLPEEGTGTVTTPDGDVTAEFAGFAPALAAVMSATSSLPAQYSFTGAEAGSPVMVKGYADALADADYGALAFHLFGIDPSAVDTAQLEYLRSLSEEAGKPILQSEMDARGLDAAILTHYTLTVANAAAYIQQAFVAPSLDEATSAIIGVDGEMIQTLPTYHALAHFARSTDPGWLRVDASGDSSELLSSAWLSPDEQAVTVVLVNPGASAVVAEVAVSEAYSALLEGARVTRTVFDGVERSAELGQLADNRVVRVPAHAVLTIAGGS